MTEQNIIVLDLETAHSVDDCLHCGMPQNKHVSGNRCFAGSTGRGFQAIGWDNKEALGLSIGCYYDYRDSHVHWFDVPTLEATMRGFVETQSLLVSFNGMQFDFPLMLACLSQVPDCLNWVADRAILTENWRRLCAASYDILDEIWKADPARKFERGLNSLDAIARANGLGGKFSQGAEAPKRWARGEYAYVLNYCQDDVFKTKALFEQIAETGMIKRGDTMPIGLSVPLTPLGDVVELPDWDSR